MSLIPWKPFQDADKFFDGDEDFFFPVFPKKKTEPDMDIYETEKEVVADVNIPNVDPETIEVSVQDNVLHVSGGKEEKKEEKDKGYWKREIRSGSFSRAVRVPSPVEGDKAEAVYENGILKVTIPKKKELEEGEGKVKVKIK